MLRELRQRCGCFKNSEGSSKAASSKVLHSPTLNSQQNQTGTFCPDSNPKDKEIALVTCLSIYVEKRMFCGKVCYTKMKLNLSPQVPGFPFPFDRSNPKTRQLKVVHRRNIFISCSFCRYLQPQKSLFEESKGSHKHVGGLRWSEGNCRLLWRRERLACESTPIPKLPISKALLAGQK